MHDSRHRSSLESKLNDKADLTWLRRFQIVSFGLAIGLGGILGGLCGRLLDHNSANGNLVSRLTAPLFGNDPSVTMFACTYLGIAAGMVIAMSVNHLLQLRAQRAVARVADHEMWRLLDDNR